VSQNHWKVECADGVSFWVASRAEAESRFWDAVRRSRISGVWKLHRPDGEVWLTVVCTGLDRVSAARSAEKPLAAQLPALDSTRRIAPEDIL
jgi:hypothetical protein